MTGNGSYLRMAVVGLLVMACDRGPAASVAPRNIAPSFDADVSGHKSSISGTIDNLSFGAPERSHMTTSGRCQVKNGPVVNQFTGDVAGTVTFHELENFRCDFSDLVGSGPFDGTVTWNGRSGVMSGQWTTNCTSDPSLPVGLSCGGTMNARGSGALEGVHFHFVWGPGWYPFAYTGEVFF